MTTTQAAATDRDFWYMGALLHMRALASDTGGAYSIVEEHLPQGFAPPFHRHENEDEAFLVLEGELTFWNDETRSSAGPGSFVMLPRGLEHTWRVDSPTARVLNILSPAGFERFFMDAGEPARELAMPPALNGPPDVERLAHISAEYQVEITGPPPGPEA
ncbi:MAG: quercetin 2,3-dioxygenase [Kineosporiaceae bacterium]|nr:quercetin 2,3-dioxygenase [Aeromicrobium sp.]